MSGVVNFPNSARRTLAELASNPDLRGFVIVVYTNDGMIRMQSEGLDKGLQAQAFLLHMSVLTGAVQLDTQKR